MSHWISYVPTVMVAHQSLPAGHGPAAGTTAAVASLGSGPSELPAKSVKLTSTLIVLSTSEDDTV